MSNQGRGNLKNYEFEKAKCPKCEREIAFSRDCRTGRLWFRRHKPCGRVVM